MGPKKSQVILLVFTLCVSMIAGGSVSAVDQWFDSYDKLPWEEEKLRLDNFAMFLKRNPKMKGYIAFYLGKDIHTSEATARIDRVRDHLVSTRDIDPTRLVLVDKGNTEKTRTILQPVLEDKPPPEFGIHSGAARVLQNLENVTSWRRCELHLCTSGY